MGREGLVSLGECQSPDAGILGLILHPSTPLAGQGAAFSPEGQPMGGYTETQPHVTVRPPGKALTP